MNTQEYVLPALVVLMIVSVLIWQAFSKHPFQFFPQTETNHYHPYYKPNENEGITFPTEEESKKKMKEDYKYQLIFIMIWVFVFGIVYLVTR